MVQEEHFLYLVMDVVGVVLILLVNLELVVRLQALVHFLLDFKEDYLGLLDVGVDSEAVDLELLHILQ